MILHIVLLKLKVEERAPAVGQLREGLARLPAVIPGLLSYHWGANVSPEALGRGYDHGFVMTFRDAAARDAYLPHPEHSKLGPLVEAVAGEVLVFDLEMGDER
jgi:hypothetical protein